MANEIKARLKILGDPLPVKLTDFDERFRRLIIFPEDLSNAVVKAKQIAGGKSISTGLVQQAMLMLEYKTMDELQADINRTKESFNLGADYKKPEIEYLKTNARSQDEFKALSGYKKVNELGVKKRIDDLSIDSLKFLQENFSSDEIVKMCSSFSEFEDLFNSIKTGIFNQEKVQTFRLLFNPEEQEVLLDNFPEILIDIELGQKYSNVTEGTRRQLVEDLESYPEALNIPEGVKNYNKVKPLNLAILFSLSENERSALLHNQHIDSWLDWFDSNTILRLDLLKQHLGNDYLYFLRNCNDAHLFLVKPHQLAEKLSSLRAAFGDKFSLKKMYPEVSERGNLRSTGISHFSIEALKQVIKTYGIEVAERLFISEEDIFDEDHDEQIPLISRLSGIEEIVGKDNFEQLLKIKEFYGFVDGIVVYNKSHQEKFGRSILEQIKRAKEQFGENKLILLLKDFAGDYFIRYSDVLFETLPPETLDLIFSAKSGRYPFFEIGFHWLERGGSQERLKQLATLPIERQKILINNGALNYIMKDSFFSVWMKDKSDRLVDQVLQSGLLPFKHFGDEPLKRSLSRIDGLVGIFGEDSILELLKKRTALKTIYELTDQSVNQWSLLLNLNDEDKKFFIENGLILELLKNPSRAEALKKDFSERLSVFFENDPLLKNQVESLVERLNRLKEQGKDVDLIIRRMVKRLTDPGISDTDKIWYLYTRIFGEEWILKGIDPLLVSASFRERLTAFKHRLEDIVVLNEDDKLNQEANLRNREFAENYSKTGKIDESVLLHGKKDFYPQDLYLGYRAAEFLGVHQYQWDEKTANALNFMLLNPSESTFTVAYNSQRDPITLSFGASKENELGITHIFLPDVVEKAHIRYGAKLYDGESHGKEHKLILGGVPVNTELAALVNVNNVKHLENVKKYYSKMPFYVPLLNVETGELVFTPQEYDKIRAELIQDGSIIDPKLDVSVDRFIAKVINYYSERDQAHGIKHIENAMQHISKVCLEIYGQNPNWFQLNNISYPEYENLVKVAVVSHDISRGTSENEGHALVGAQVLSELVDYGLPHGNLQKIESAIKQHNLPKEKRWSNDPITQALYDIDKADTSFERGADLEYVRMIMPTIQTKYTRDILESILAAN